MIAAVVLAAGASTRLGEPKQLATLGGEPLLERAVRVAREAGCSPVIVVLGSSAAEIRAACTLRGVHVIVNEAWPEGMASSIRAGVRATIAAQPEAGGGVLLLTCDQPAVTASHLRALMASGELTASQYAGRLGVPAYLPAAMLGALLELEGDAGARGLLREARAVALPGGELDVDTPGTLAEARRLFA
jgi:molybdenum cofactor cytidylyltransferase